MKLKISLKSIGNSLLTFALAFGAWSTSNAQCLTNTSQFPSNAVLPTIINGTTWTEISSCNYEEEYAIIQTMGGQVHQVQSSSPATFITISLDNGLSSFATGTGSVSFTPPTSGEARVFFNTNSSCATASNCITTSYKIGTPNTCLPPSNLVVSNVSSTTANIAWTAASPAPANGYDYYVTTASTIPMANVAPTGSSSTTSATLGSLTMGSNYKVWMRSKCSGTSIGYWNLLDSFTTEVILPRPWTEGFSAGVLPSGFLGNFDWFVDQIPGFLEGNPGAAIFGFVYSGMNPLTTPNISGVLASDVLMIDYNLLELSSFSPIPAAVGSMYFKVFISNNFGQTYTQIDSVPAAGANSWSYKVYPLSSYAGQTIKVKIEANSNSFTSIVALDNYYIGAAPSCFPPTAPAASNITNSSATISWSAAYQAPANGYEYYYNTTGIAPTNATAALGSVGAGVTSANLPSLTAGTTYYFWLRSACSSSDKSNWTSGGSFITETMVARPWSEGFSSWSLPAGFLGSDWFVENDPSFLVGNPGYGLFTYNDSWTNNTQITTLNVSGILANDVLMFDYRHFDGIMAPAPAPAGAGYVKILVSNNWGQSYTQIDSFTSLGSSSWNEKVYPLTAYAGQTIKIKIVSGSNSGEFYAGFDNFYIGTAPTCFKPNSGSISNITLNSASIAWIAPTQLPANGYEYYYTTSLATPNSATVASGAVAAGTTTANLSALNSGTLYNVWVRSVCSNTDKSLWFSLGSFTTQVVTPRPWSEPFANYDVLPNGFDVSPSYGDFWIVIDEPPYITGNPSNALFTGHEFASPTPNTVATINVSGILAGDELKFDYRYFDVNTFTSPLSPPAAGSAYFKVLISTNYGATYTTLATENNVSTNGWTTKTYSLNNYAGQTVRVKIECYSNVDEVIAGFDNFYIGACTPASVGSITVSGTAPSYNFTATGAQNVNTYTWIYGDNTPNGSGANVDHTYNVNGTYTVKLIVTNPCGSDTVEQQVVVTGASVNDLNITNDNLKLYPNPAQHLLSIENLSAYKMKSVLVYNILGQKVLQQKVKSNADKIDVSALSNGLHTIIVEFEEGKTSRKFDVVK